jgi:glutathione synthase
LERLAYAMHVATQRYQECYYLSNSNDHQANTNKKMILAILFVVQDGESNTVDQRLLEFQLFQTYNIPVIRQSLTKLYKTATVNVTTGALIVDGVYEIALVYYRAGYAPTDYPSGYLFDNNTNTDNEAVAKEWKARARMEMSRATKCPSLGYHLAGTKKVQQALARPGILEQFVHDQSAAAAMRRVFAGLYSTSQEDMVEADYQAVHDVIVNKNSHLYVLKPQREGGGYNFYGEKLAEKLTQNVQIMNEKDDSRDKKNKMILNDALGEYILMQRLFPPEQNAILLRSGRVEGIGKCISELGIFGTILCGPSTSSSSSSSSSDVTTTPTSSYSNQDVTILHNEYAGFLLRTKFSHVDEGGVASGFATLSSPYLC